MYTMVIAPFEYSETWFSPYVIKARYLTNMVVLKRLQQDLNCRFRFSVDWNARRIHLQFLEKSSQNMVLVIHLEGGYPKSKFDTNYFADIPGEDSTVNVDSLV